MIRQKKTADYCPLIKKNCIEHKCAWYMHVIGLDPNTGQSIDHWGCAISWIPTLTIENSQQQRQTAAAVESFRNEVVRSNEENRTLILNEMINKFGIIPANVTPMSCTNLLTSKHLEDDEKNMEDNTNQ
jgi:hypothetical protein